MNSDSSNTLDYFLDNTQGGGQGEWSVGSVASIRIYNAAVSSGTLPVTPVPEPETVALMAAGLGVVGLLARRRRQG